MFDNVSPHPEWKRLYHAVKDIAVPGQQYSYDELAGLAGVDIRTNRGRQQFFRFRLELLRTHSLYFVCVRGEGYRIIQGHEHGRCGNGQLRSAGRRIKAGTEIVYNTRLESLTEEQRKANADILCRLGRIQADIKDQRRQINKVVKVIEQGRLPSPLLDASKEASQ